MLYSQEIKNISNNFEKSKKKEIINWFQNELKSNENINCIKIAYDRNDLKEIEFFSSFLKNNFKYFFIIGIGGSSLGAMTFLSLSKNKNIFISESIDSETIENIINNLDYKNTAFISISKSGKTIECISQTLIFMKKIEDKYGKELISKNFFFLTENRENPLTNLAKEFNIKIIEHNETIGGRFSFLSNVSLLPSSLAELNIYDIRNGAIDTIEYFLSNENNNILDIILSQYEMTKNNLSANVIMPYIDKLYHFTYWYRQLWAESLGKNENGTIPINAIGTSDQHSQLQLYIDGPKNKFYTFIFKEKNKNSIKIEKNYIKELDYLKYLSLDDIMEIEFNSSIEILSKKKLPIRIIKFKELNEKSLAQLMTQYVIETIIMGKMLNINPFGQPAVEERKIIARQMIKELNNK